MKNLPNRDTVIRTERLLLRAWQDTDAERLFYLARDPRIGQGAGFPPHMSVADSLHVIRHILSEAGNFAIVRCEDNLVIGSVGIQFSHENNPEMKQGEVEIGYWVGMKYQGMGYATEAARAVVHHAFCEMDCLGVWCSCLPANFPSRRVQEKCGFTFHHNAYGVYVSQIAATRDVVYTYLSAQAYQEQKGQ